ncbi:MAG: hypothetical protein ACE5JQ_05840 [Candidatus Methylomirabilales bacterium]
MVYGHLIKDIVRLQSLHFQKNSQKKERKNAMAFTNFFKRWCFLIVVIYMSSVSLSFAQDVNHPSNVTIGGDLTVDGNVGMGTASPAARLNVRSGSDTEPVLKMTAAGNTSTRFLLERTGASAPDLIVTGGSGAVVGNVGIGTASPERALHVGTGAGQVTFGVGKETVQPKLNFSSGGARAVVGYNVTEDATHFSTASQVAASIEFGAGGSTIFRNDSAAVGGTAVPERMRLTNSGNVGIGTASPAARLNVWSGSDTEPVLKMTAAGNTSTRFLLERTGASAPDLIVTGGSGAVVGNVGIGTASPAAKLHVAGDAQVDGNIAAKYQDVAEWVPASTSLPPGTVVVIDPVEGNRVLLASQPYDTRVAGVVSPRPGILLGEPGDDKVKVAHSGRVKVKADSQYGPIEVGDLLVTSATPGYAMRSKPVDVNGISMHRPGTIVGKALEPLKDGKGEILTLLTLQ